MITLVLGGAASGKSMFAEQLAARGQGGPVVYVATAQVGDDPSMAQRVRRHRDRRPSWWGTVECGTGLVDWLSESAPPAGTVLIESLGTWVAGHPGLDPDGNGLAAALGRLRCDAIVVSEEVGLAVHPSTAVGGLFRDALGLVNQQVSAVADSAFLVVAGRALPLPAFGYGDVTG